MEQFIDSTTETFLTFSTNLLYPCILYTRAILGCLLGFWSQGQNPAGAIRVIIACLWEVDIFPASNAVWNEATRLSPKRYQKVI